MRRRCWGSAALAAALAVAQPVWAGDSEAQVLAAVNAARAKAGCRALVMNDQLTSAAYGHAKAMAVKNFFGHYGQNGSKPSNRVKAQGYRTGYTAENIAMGYASPEKVMDVWMNSAGHRQNILNCGVTETGIAVYYQADDKPLPGNSYTAKYYWVEVFARPR